jgi:hypothetical protein
MERNLFYKITISSRQWFRFDIHKIKTVDQYIQDVTCMIKVSTFGLQRPLPAISPATEGWMAGILNCSTRMQCVAFIDIINLNTEQWVVKQFNFTCE